MLSYWFYLIWEKLYPFMKNYSQIHALVSCYNRHFVKLTVKWPKI